MKKTLSSEPRAKRPRISKSDSQKSKGGENKTGRSYRKSDDTTSSFGRKSRTSENSAFGERKSRSSSERNALSGRKSQRNDHWESDNKPRRTGNEPWKAEKGDRSYSGKPRRADSNSTEGTKEFRKKAGGPWKPGKSAGNTWNPENKPRRVQFKNQKVEDDSKVWDSESREWVSAPSKEKRNSTGGKLVKGKWNTSGGSRTRNVRSRSTENKWEAPVKQSREYKKVTKKTTAKPRAFAEEGNSTEQKTAKPSKPIRALKGSPWKSDAKPYGTKSKKSTSGKGPGAKTYSRAHKASNGPHKKKTVK